MILRSIRALAALCLLTIPAGVVPHAAQASSSTSSFTNNQGETFSVTRSSSFDRSTRTATETRSVTGPMGKTETASVTSTPDGRGGFTVSRSFTGFNGQTHTNSHTVGR